MYFQSINVEEKIERTALMNTFNKIIWLMWAMRMEETDKNKYNVHFGPNQIRLGGHCQESYPEGGV